MDIGITRKTFTISICVNLKVHVLDMVQKTVQLDTREFVVDNALIIGTNSEENADNVKEQKLHGCV
jgi:hypothetical protein